MARAPGSRTTHTASSWISCCTTRFSRKSRRFSSCRLATDGRGVEPRGRPCCGVPVTKDMCLPCTRPLQVDISAIPACRTRNWIDLCAQAWRTFSTGETPTLVRPPFWRFDERTLKAYHACGLLMLLTDISARDGVIYGWTISLRRRSHFAAALAQVRRAIQEGKLQIVEGAIPVIVTFHDTNTFTASHMEEYLQILVDQAHAVGLPLARLPFYNEHEQI